MRPGSQAARRRGSLAGVLVALSLAGCAGGAKGTLKAVPYDQVTYKIPHPFVDPHGAPGKATPLITAGMNSDPKTFNFYMAQDYTSLYPVINAYEGLVGADMKTAEVYPDLAESWTETPDHLHVTFKLRDGLKWSDGQPLTADDVAFTYMRIVENPKIPDNSNVDAVKVNGKFIKVTALDPLHVRFDLPEPYSPFLDTAAGLPIMPRHQWAPYVEKYDASGKTLYYQAFSVAQDFAKEPMIGCGPYIPVYFKPGEYIVLNRNPYYAQRVDKAGHALPYADQLLYEIVPNADAESLKFVAKETDIGMDAQRPADYEYLKRLEKVGQYHMVDGGRDFGTTMFIFNLNKDHDPNHKPYVSPLHESWISNVHLRRAFSHCVDRKTIIDNVAFGLNQPAYGPESPSSPFYNPNIPTYPYDLDAARQELIAGGFHPGDKTHPCTDAQGHKVELDVWCYTDNQVSVITSNMVADELAKLGVTLHVKQTTFINLLTKVANTLDFEIAYMNLGGGPEPNAGKNIWMHDGALHQFWQRRDKSTDVQPPYPWELQVDRDFTMGARVFGRENRRKYYDDYQRIIADQVPQVYVWYQERFYAVHDDIRNAAPTTLQEALGNTGYTNIYQLYKP